MRHTLLGHKGMDRVSSNQYSSRLWCLNGAQLILKDQTISRKYLPHHYTTNNLNRWYKAGWSHDFVLFTQFWLYYLSVAAETVTHQTWQIAVSMNMCPPSPKGHRSRISHVLSWNCAHIEPNPHVDALFLNGKVWKWKCECRSMSMYISCVYRVAICGVVCLCVWSSVSLYVFVSASVYLLLHANLTDLCL